MYKKEVFKFNTKVKVSILIGISLILMYFRIGIPIFPTFLDFDFSDIPILFIGIVFSPLTSIVAMAIKNILKIIFMGSITFGVGEFANFLMGSFFVFSVSFSYIKYSNKFLSFFIGMFFLVVSGILLNYFLILPFYMKVLGVNLYELIGERSVLQYLIYYIVPYNIIKSIIIFFPTIFIYDKFKKINSRNIS